MAEIPAVHNPMLEEDEISFIPGARGNNHLVYQSLVYIFHRQNAGSVRWRCQKREAHNGKCAGKLSTNLERMAILVGSKVGHNQDKDNLAVRKSMAAAPGQRTVDVSMLNFICV